METDQGLAGEAMDVTFELRNTGDAGGAKRVDILVNGTTEISKRYSVDSGERRTITEQLTFEEPGTYNVTVERRHVGNVSISRTVVETTADRSDGRSSLVRAKRVPYDSQVTATFPANNDTFVLESLRMQSTRTEFTRNVETYTVPENASFAVPDGADTTVIGAATIESADGVDDRHVRMAVNRSTLTDAGLSSADVEIYESTDDGFQRLDSELIMEDDSRYIYVIQESDTEQFVVGSVSPTFEVSDHSLSATNVDDEKRVVVSANVTNTGGIKGNYTATVLLDNEAVTNQTVELEPGEETTVTLNHRITDDGSYRVALDDQFVGTVVLSSGSDGGEETATDTEDSSDETTDEETTDQGTTDEESTDSDDDQTATASSESTESGTASTDDSDDGEAGIPLPGTDDVGLTEVAIGVGVAIIGIILVLLQRW